jgi:hypothetical protein
MLFPWDLGQRLFRRPQSGAIRIASAHEVPVRQGERFFHLSTTLKRDVRDRPRRRCPSVNSTRRSSSGSRSTQFPSRKGSRPTHSMRRYNRQLCIKLTHDDARLLDANQACKVAK